ncbi:hypothetical protein DPMN_047806 [Dreissena polymorpha]|uniref:Tyr recombinase domain-containing protein n=1 Tax=Dreissena polymorpha TaxID=45954 RepID=A0A9D4D8Q2_DREPO|nr:hypothetical protein DPMN_047806 [Dreissena polymorpha]
MRPSDFSSKHLLNLAIRTNDTASQWFLRQQLGVNKLGQMLKAMAKDAGFLKHKRITNHSVRKFLVQKLRNANIPPTETMAIIGHKNVQSISNYSNISVKQQQKCSFLLSPGNVTIQQIPLVHFHAPKLWPKCSLDNQCLPSNKLILMFAPPSHFTSKCLSLVRTTLPHTFWCHFPHSLMYIMSLTPSNLMLFRHDITTYYNKEANIVHLVIDLIV